MVSHQICKASTPKYVFFSLKWWTPILKTHFSIYKPVKFGPRAHKFGAWVLKVTFPNLPIRGPNAPIQGPIFYEPTCLLLARIRGPNWTLMEIWNLSFFVLSAPIFLIVFFTNDRVSSATILWWSSLASSNIYGRFSPATAPLKSLPIREAFEANTCEIR